MYRSESTIQCAGTALHAAVLIGNNRPSVFKNKNTMRTDLDTPAATRAFFCRQLQGNHIGEIFHCFLPPNLKVFSDVTPNYVCAFAIPSNSNKTTTAAM